jgi:hypothetical protein
MVFSGSRIPNPKLSDNSKKQESRMALLPTYNREAEALWPLVEVHWEERCPLLRYGKHIILYLERVSPGFACFGNNNFSRI